MKNFCLTAGFVAALVIVPSGAMAACSVAAGGTRVNTVAQLTTLLRGNTVCVPVATQAVMTAQEEHRIGGQLWDYKKGPADPVDPTARIGSWDISRVVPGGTLVTYDYGNGQTYSYSVWKNADDTYSFCSANPEVTARIKTGRGPC